MMGGRYSRATVASRLVEYALLIVILVSTATAMFESLTYFRADCADPIKDLGKREPINLLGLPWDKSDSAWYIFDDSKATCLQMHWILELTGAVCSGIFLVEFVCRVISHPYYLHYAVTPYGIVDMLAIFPTLTVFALRMLGMFDGIKYYWV